MKGILKLSIVLIALLFSACNKNGKNRYSQWSVNGEDFSTKDVEAIIGKGACILTNNDKQNGFFLIFRSSGSLPDQGAYLMKYLSNPQSGIVSIGIYYNGQIYTPSQTPEMYLEPHPFNEKAQYNINQTWFINYNVSSDSVLVSATFNEP